MGEREQREIRLIVADAGGTSLATVDGSLPTIQLELREGETTLTSLARDVLPALRLDTPVVDCFIDQQGDPAGPVAVLVAVEPVPATWRLPDGWAWRSAAHVDATVAPALQDHATQLVEERRGRRPVPELRPMWARAGWYERATSWIGHELVATGRGRPLAVDHLRHWGISAVMRVTLDDGRCWFKAVFPHFRAEPAITALLDRELPGTVAPVIAIEPSEGWLLLDDVGDDVAAAAEHLQRDVVAQLISMQRTFGERSDELLAVGAPHRPLRDLPDSLASALRSPAVRAFLDVAPDRTAWITQWLRDASADVDALGYPETLVHGDFHPGNVAIAQGRPVIFDWSDGAISHPLIDVLTWTWWYEEQPERVDEIWSWFLDGWRDLVAPERFAPLRQRFEGVASAYHTISYAGIVDGLEPTRRIEHAGGLTSFFSKLDAAVTATS